MKNEISSSVIRGGFTVARKVEMYFFEYVPLSAGWLWCIFYFKSTVKRPILIVKEASHRKASISVHYYSAGLFVSNDSSRKESWTTSFWTQKCYWYRALKKVSFWNCQKFSFSGFWKLQSCSSQANMYWRPFSLTSILCVYTLYYSEYLHQFKKIMGFSKIGLSFLVAWS